MNTKTASMNPSSNSLKKNFVTCPNDANQIYGHHNHSISYRLIITNKINYFIVSRQNST